LFKILGNHTLQINPYIYYQEYADFLAGPFTIQKEISFIDLLKFHHPPLWFMFLGAMFWLFGFHVWVIYFSQTVLGVFTLWLAYAVGRKIWGHSVGLLSALVLSTLPSFLIITRQGYLETMICPILLIGVALVYSILEYPLTCRNYILLGLLCGVGMLIKSTFLFYAFLFFAVLIIFVDKKMISSKVLLKNIALFFSLMILIALPWYTYAYKNILYYYLLLIDKGIVSSLFDATKGIFAILPLLQNIQLGSFMFFISILSFISLYIKPKFHTVWITFFLVLGYSLTAMSCLSIIARHFSPFLPLLIMPVCYGIINLPWFKHYVVLCLVIFCCIQGYGWFMPSFIQINQMRYFYDDIGMSKSGKEEYHSYVTDVNPGDLFSSFAPLPAMQQKTVYEKIKNINFNSDLKLVRIISHRDLRLEKNTLGGALSLYSMLETYPLLIEDVNAVPFKVCFPQERIWVFLRYSNESVDFSILDGNEVTLIQSGSVSLLPTVTCDIFSENKDAE